MKIKLKIDIPVNKKHDLKAGQIHEVLKMEMGMGRGHNGYWIAGNGERVKRFTDECEIVEN